MPSADAIAWETGANDNLNESPNPPKKPPQRRGNVEAWNRLFEELGRPERFAEPTRVRHPSPVIRPAKTVTVSKPTLVQELRKLIAQGIPPEKAAQIIAERYGVKAEVRKVQMPSISHLSEKLSETINKSRARFEKEYPEIKVLGQLVNRETELEYRLSIEKDLGTRLRLAIEHAPIALAVEGINYPIRAFTGKPIEDLFKPLFKIGAEYNKMLGKASGWVEKKGEIILGTKKQREQIYQTILGEGTISKTPSIEISKLAEKKEPFMSEFLKAPINLASTPTFIYQISTKPAETVLAMEYQARTEPLAMLGALAGTGLLTSGFEGGVRFAKAKIGAKLGEFKPTYSIVEFGKETITVKPYSERPINIGFVGEFSKEEAPILKKIHEHQGATIDYLQKSLGIEKKKLLNKLKIMQDKGLVKIVNDRVYLNKMQLKEVTIGRIRESKPIWSGIAMVAKKSGIEFKGAKPISTTVVESAFKIGEKIGETERLGGLVKVSEKTKEEIEGTAIAKVRPRFGFEVEIPSVDKIRITTIYKNLLGKTAMISSEFTEEGAKIVAKKGKESTGFGFKILEKSPIFIQDITENPPIVISKGGRIARAWISGKEISKGFELEIEEHKVGFEEEFKPPFVQSPKRKTSKEEFKPIETGSGQALLATEETPKVQIKQEPKTIPILDVSKEVKALEKMITESKPVAGFAPTIPLVAPPAFNIALPQVGQPTFSVPTMPIETELIKPKTGVEFFTPAVNIGFKPTISSNTRIGVSPLVAPILNLSIQTKPIVGTKPFVTPIEIVTPKVEPITKSKPLIDVGQKPKVGFEPKVGFKPFTTPIPNIGIPSIGIPPVTPINIPPFGFNGGWGIPSFVFGKSKKKRGKKKYIGLLAGYTEVTLTELLTGHKAHHLMIPAKMAKFWKETLKTGGMIEVPTAEEVLGLNKKGRKRKKR